MNIVGRRRRWVWLFFHLWRLLVVLSSCAFDCAPTRQLWDIYVRFQCGDQGSRSSGMIRIGKGESRAGCSIRIDNAHRLPPSPSLASTWRCTTFRPAEVSTLKPPCCKLAGGALDISDLNGPVATLCAEQALLQAALSNVSYK